ncbi:protein giant-like [Aphidius gifuensis]|uniref:protein giant-like n=1 Tax=Aphidius gifuensis TaxID=684658 RepID=UPI001CDD2938|nr:protein giant-like [Aphidius gifuensis]
MENYHLINGQPEALDFTSPKKEYIDSAPALDLSFKKLSDVKNTSYMLSPSSSNFSSSPPSSESNMDQHDRSFNDDDKNSYHESTYMVTTPPPDSPKINKYNDTIYAGLNSTNDELINNHYSRMQMFLPTVVPSMIGPLLTTSGGTVQQMQLPITSSSSSSSSSSIASTVIPPTAKTNDLPMIIQQDTNKKAPRPFKAYPKDPLSLTMGPELMYDQNSNGLYNAFRKRMLESVKRTNEGTNIKMRRISNKSPTLPTSTMDEKDAAYWERRKKNNEAAKRSRDARRAKEDEIAIRAAYLEQENVKFKFEIMALQQEVNKLRSIAYRN